MSQVWEAWKLNFSLLLSVWLIGGIWRIDILSSLNPRGENVFFLFRIGGFDLRIFVSC